MRFFKSLLFRTMQHAYDFHALRSKEMVGASSLVHTLLTVFVLWFFMDLSDHVSPAGAAMRALMFVALLELVFWVVSRIPGIIAEPLAAATSKRFFGVKILSIQDENGTSRITFRCQRSELTFLDEDNMPILTESKRSASTEQVVLMMGVCDVDALRILSQEGDQGEFVSYEMRGVTPVKSHMDDLGPILNQYRFVFPRWSASC